MLRAAVKSEPGVAGGRDYASIARRVMYSISSVVQVPSSSTTPRRSAKDARKRLHDFSARHVAPRGRIETGRDPFE